MRKRKKTVQPGELIDVDNSERTFGSAPSYTAGYVKIKGKFYPVAITDVELQTMKNRALQNPEDMPRLSSWSWLFG